MSSGKTSSALKKKIIGCSSLILHSSPDMPDYLKLSGPLAKHTDDWAPLQGWPEESVGFDWDTIQVDLVTFQIWEPCPEGSFPARLLHLVNALMMIQNAPDSFSQQWVDFLFILLIFTKN